MRFRQLRSSVSAIVFVVGIIGCAASTKIVNEWRNPDYSSPRFKKMLVIAVSRASAFKEAKKWIPDTTIFWRNAGRQHEYRIRPLMVKNTPPITT